MTCLIVDDNQIARTTLAQLASLVKDLEIVSECGSAVEAYNLLQEQKIDILLLDIEMPGMSGIELTRNLGKDGPVIIFTTSKREYAVEAFELNVADYVLKPIVPARFIQAIDKAREVLDSNKVELRTTEDEFLFIRDSNIVRRLALDDLLFAEAMGDYVKLHTPGRFYAVHTTLKAVEDRLPQGRFLRVHRSYIVSLEKVDTIQEGLLVIQGRNIPVADSYRAALNKRMKIL